MAGFPVLIVVGGLPATGKSTVSCVNPLGVTRDAWRGVASSAEAGVLEVELICTDLAAHRTRVQTREVDIPGLALPSWQQVLDHDYEPRSAGEVPRSCSG